MENSPHWSTFWTFTLHAETFMTAALVLYWKSHLMYDDCISPSRCRGSQMWINSFRESLLYWQLSKKGKVTKERSHFSFVRLSPWTKAAFFEHLDSFCFSVFLICWWSCGLLETLASVKVTERPLQPLQAGTGPVTRSIPCTVGMTQQML